MISKSLRVKKTPWSQSIALKSPPTLRLRQKGSPWFIKGRANDRICSPEYERKYTRDTIESGWHIWHHRIRDWQLVSKACYFSRVDMYNIDSRCHHPSISVSYFSTGVSSISMILQIIEKWVVLQALWSPLRVVDTRTKIKPKITLDFKVRLACIGRCQDIGHWNVWFDQGSLNVELGLSPNTLN